MSRIDRIVVGAAIALPWLLIWQGLDVTDQGYNLTIYRNFLRHPEAVAHTSHMWLTNVVGGIWDLLFGSLGVVGQRALWALCTSVGLWLSFRAVRVCSGERAAAFGVLVVSAFVIDRRETCFSYNTSTTLLSALAAVALFHGLRLQRLGLLAAAGLCLGLTPFARLSNLSQGALLVAPLFAAWLDRSRLSRLSRELGAAGLGYLAGVAVALLCMAALGHWSYFWSASYDLLHPTAPSVNHDPGGMLMRLVNDHAMAIPIGIAVCGVGVLLAWVWQLVPRSAALGLYLVAGGLAAYVLARQAPTSTYEPWTWFVVGPCYVALAVFAFAPLGRSFEQRLASFIGLLALFFTPLGTDNGIRSAHMGMTFALPLVLAQLYSAAPDGTQVRPALRALAVVAGLVVVVESIERTLTYTYRDGSRLTLWTPVSHPQLRAQLTTPARARVVAEVLDALSTRVAPNDYLLAYDGTPLLQYLTRTRPYTGKPWLMTDDDPAVIPGLLKASLKKARCLPVAVRSLRSARSYKWPGKGQGLERPQAATRKAITTFLKRNHYKATWRNDFFEILEPPRDGTSMGACR